MNIAKTPLTTIFGTFEFICFSWGEHEDQSVLCLTVPPKDERIPLVRLQSACFTAEIFRSNDCDCHEQLETALRLIQEQGGALIDLLQDGRGAGIFQKTLALGLLANEGLDTADAYDRLGIPRDPRTYDRTAAVLSHLGHSAVRLLTNNPRKVAGLEAAGIGVSRVPLEVPPTADSLPYLATKRNKMGHLLHLGNHESGTE